MEHTQESLLLREYVLREEWSELPQQYENLHVQDVAEGLQTLEPEQIVRAMAELPRERWSDVFAYMERSTQQRLLQRFEEDDSRFVLDQLSQDDLIALLESLPKDEVEQLFKLLTPKAVKEALRLLGYPEHSAGRLMTADFVTVRPDWTLARALDHVRARGDHGEGVNTLYVTSNFVHRSKDDGATWETLGAQTKVPWEYPRKETYLRGIVADPGDPKSLLLGFGDFTPGSSGAVAQSRDLGKSWRLLRLPVAPNSTIWTFATNRADPNIIFAASRYGYLYRSDCGGESWTKLSREFSEIAAVRWLPN
jgi:hypothetical protein